MFKKSISVLLCVCMLLSCFIFSGFAAVTVDKIKETVLADAVSDLTSEASDLGMTLEEFVTDITVGEPTPLYNEKDEIVGYLVYVDYNTSTICVWDFEYIIDVDGKILYFGYCFNNEEHIEAPVGGKLYYCDWYGSLWFCYPDGNLINEDGNNCTRETMNDRFARARVEEAEYLEELKMEELVNTTNSVSDIVNNLKTLDFEKFIEYFTNFIRKICEYVIERYIPYYTGTDKSYSEQEIDEKVNSYCIQHNCTLKEVYRADKDYFVPNSQTYFSDGEDVGDGVCGVASWEMVLGGYRDNGTLSKLPDDRTMYREIMAIMDDISDEIQPVITKVLDENTLIIDDVINPLMIDTIGMYIDKEFDFNSYEVLGTLDIGIALYLYQYGYTDFANRVLSNLTISIPVLSYAKRNLLMRDLKNEISGWLYKKTDGKLNIPTGMGSTAEDTVLRSLERGEPVVFGCWMSLLGDDDLTNHYFVISSLFKLEAEIKITETKTVTVERNLVEVYDTWSNSRVELVDFDALCRTTLCDANSLALLF